MVHKAAVLEDPAYLSTLCESNMASSDVMPAPSTSTETPSVFSTDLNKPNAEGATPLMLACQEQRVDNVKRLLQEKVHNVFRMNVQNIKEIRFLVKITNIKNYFVFHGTFYKW